LENPRKRGLEMPTKPKRQRTREAVVKEIQKQKGTTKNWSKGPAPLQFRKGSGVVFSLRLPTEELEEIRDLASRGGLSVSEFIRQRILPKPHIARVGTLTLDIPLSNLMSFKNETSVNSPPPSGVGGLRVVA
jgi:hypothetical protein